MGISQNLCQHFKCASLNVIKYYYFCSIHIYPRWNRCQMYTRYISLLRPIRYYNIENRICVQRMLTVRHMHRHVDRVAVTYLHRHVDGVTVT